MSCTPTSNSLERSLSPLSPSDESRFVPSQPSGVMDEHYKSSPSDDDKKKKVDTDTKVQQDDTFSNNTSKTTAFNNTDAPKQPNLVAEEEDDEEGGIVGATICFTPEPSPRSSPNMGGIEGNNDATGVLSKLDSLNSNSNDYIGSVQGAPSDRSNSRKSSSVMHVASSLDGRSTTEYELLDALSSKGTIEVEELVLDEDDEDCDAPSLDEKKEEGKRSGSGELVSTMLASNPSSGATVASDAPFKHPDTSNNQVPAFVVSSKPDDEAVKLDFNSEDVNEEKDLEDTSTSSKVDSRPLTPFKSLHKFWQGQATKGMLGRILGTDISKDDTEEDAQTTPTPDEPLGTHVDELDGSPGYQQDDEANHAAAVPKTQWLVNCLSALFSSAAQYVVSCLVTAGLLIGVFVYGYISSILGTMKALVQRILHQRIKKRAIDQLSNDVVEKVLQDAVDKIVLNSKETAVFPPEHTTTATNLPKLFTADEKLQEDKEVSTALEPKEKALLQKINDKVTASIVTKGKEALLALKDNKVLSSIISVALISVFLIGSYMLQHGGTGGSQESDDISIHLDANHSLFNLHCVMTHSTSYHDIPLWLMLLSPTSFEDEVATASRYWLFTFAVFSILSSMFVALKSKIPFPFTKPDILTGIWSEEEHQQFLAGYNVHGTKWKLVSAFVPTRTHNQVKAHGCYWMKIRSPARMPKSRKELTPVRTSFGSTLSAGLLSPRTPSSVCSTKSTPRKSNKKSKQATTPTPLKGILVEKSSNQQFDKNVTPRSAERKKRMQNRKKQGSKSDPVKRRVRIQAP